MADGSAQPHPPALLKLFPGENPATSPNIAVSDHDSAVALRSRWPHPSKGLRTRLGQRFQKFTTTIEIDTIPLGMFLRPTVTYIMLVS